MEAVTAIYERMRATAIAEGERFLAAEQALEDAFRANTVTEESLRAMLAEIGRSRARLRFIHLSAHLGTPKLLTAGQIARYAALRGYHAHRGRNGARWAWAGQALRILLPGLPDLQGGPLHVEWMARSERAKDGFPDDNSSTRETDSEWNHP